MKTKLKQISSLFLSLTSCVLILNSCDTNDPPPGNGNKETITISVEDTSPTEVWLNLTTQNLKLPADLLLLRNGDASNVFSLTQTDTLIYDDSLQPSTTYTYQVSSIKNQVSSNEVTFTTMDTTSHNFTWQTYTFGGEGGSSALYDVAIIDENNIWAVGEIYTADDKYNAVHWDGSSWQYKQLQFFTFCEQSHTGIYPARSILAFSATEILISSGSQVTFHDGEKQIKTECIPTSVNKMWGTDINNVYAVGAIGNIARFDGSSWQKIESGTVLDFQDIWGDYNEKTQEWEILAVASNHLSGYEREIIKIEGDRIRSISNEPLTSTISSTWFISSRKYLIGGSGIYSKAQIDQVNWQKEDTINKYYTYKIRGNSINDIVAVGGYGDLQHYNGINWGSQYEITKIDGNYRSVSTKGNKVVAVGQHNAQAVIIIGRR